jgi:predicted metal-dependent hydrolase
MDPLLERGIALFNAGHYFECHEVLEESWTPERGPRRLFLQGLIHVAVGIYHDTRLNQVGASRQLRKALRKLAGYGPVFEEVDLARLCRDVTGILREIEAGRPVGRYPEIRLVRGRAGGR